MAAVTVPLERAQPGGAAAPPDAILGEVFRRTGDQPFRSIDEVISREELVAISEGYKRIAGYDQDALGSAETRR